MNICACGCNRYAPPEHAVQDAGGAWWRMDCAARSLKLMRCLQNLPAHDLGALVALLERNGFGTGVIVGALPFDQEIR